MLKASSDILQTSQLGYRLASSIGGSFTGSAGHNGYECVVMEIGGRERWVMTRGSYGIRIGSSGVPWTEPPFSG